MTVKTPERIATEIDRFNAVNRQESEKAGLGSGRGWCCQGWQR